MRERDGATRGGIHSRTAAGGSGGCGASIPQLNDAREVETA
jgi:hypothetical protein